MLKRICNISEHKCYDLETCLTIVDQWKRYKTVSGTGTNRPQIKVPSGTVVVILRFS